MDFLFYIFALCIYLFPIWKLFKLVKKTKYPTFWFGLSLMIYCYIFFGFIYLLVINTNTLGEYGHFHDLLVICLYASFFVAFSLLFIVPIFLIVHYIIKRMRNKIIDDKGILDNEFISE
jgi:hypothetical protein